MSTATRNLRRRAATCAHRLHGRVSERGCASDRGAGAIEYAGIVILVAGIILAIRALGLPAQISGAISNWVSAIVGGG